MQSCLCKSPPFSGAGCYFLKEWEFAEFTSAASGERHGKNASRSTHPERIWSAEDEWVKDLCLGGQSVGLGRGPGPEFRGITLPPQTPWSNENPPPKYRLGKKVLK